MNDEEIRKLDIDPDRVQYDTPSANLSAEIGGKLGALLRKEVAANRGFIAKNANAFDMIVNIFTQFICSECMTIAINSSASEIEAKHLLRQITAAVQQGMDFHIASTKDLFESDCKQYFQGKH